MRIVAETPEKIRIVGHESEIQELQKWRELINLSAVHAQTVISIEQNKAELVITKNESDEMINWKKSKPKN